MYYILICVYHKALRAKLKLLRTKNEKPLIDHLRMLHLPHFATNSCEIVLKSVLNCHANDVLLWDCVIHHYYTPARVLQLIWRVAWVIEESWSDIKTSKCRLTRSVCLGSKQIACAWFVCKSWCKICSITCVMLKQLKHVYFPGGFWRIFFFRTRERMFVCIETTLHSENKRDHYNPLFNLASSFQLQSSLRAQYYDGMFA